MSKCNCFIGEINGYEPMILELSNFIEKIQSECNTSNHVAEFYNNNPNKKVKKKLASPMDYLDRRKGYSTLFNYCPYCGTKINWRQLKNELKNQLKIK